MPQQPNVLLIMSDMHRSDALGCYGNVFIDTPNLDKLAARGTKFTHCFTPIALCTPARATLWSGMYPHAHNVVGNVYGVANAFEKNGKVDTLLFDHLRDAGYESAYIGKWHLGDENPGCFDTWAGHNSMGGHWVDGKQSMQGGTYMPDAETDTGIQFLKSQIGSDKPFVMVQSYYPPHGPITVHEHYSRMYRERGVPFPGYYGACTAIDNNIGKLLAALETTGHADNTIIVYFSDHGTSFDARDCNQHARVCYDEAVRVPLIIVRPKDISLGRSVNAFVGLQDVAPTVLNFCGVNNVNSMQGRSLTPWLDGEPESWRDCFYFENTFNPHIYTVSFATKDQRVIGPYSQRAIRTDKWKLILSDGGPHELYNLEHDPDEVLDLYGAPYEDMHIQFRHFPKQDDTIYELAQLAEKEAIAIDDELGIKLARLILNNPVERYDWDNINATGVRI